MVLMDKAKQLAGSRRSRSWTRCSKNFNQSGVPQAQPGEGGSQE